MTALHLAFINATRTNYSSRVAIIRRLTSSAPASTRASYGAVAGTVGDCAESRADRFGGAGVASELAPAVPSDCGGVRRPPVAGTTAHHP